MADSLFAEWCVVGSHGVYRRAGFGALVWRCILDGAFKAKHTSTVIPAQAGIQRVF